MFKPKSLAKNTLNRQIIILSVLSIISISIFIPYASASVLSASDNNAPSGADLLTLNNTSKAPLFWVNSNGKLFAASNADFHNSTSVFDSSKFCIRNPASTFTTCITNGANLANRTLNWPVLSGTDTIATLGVSNAFSGSNSFSGTTDFLQSTEKFGSSGIVIRNPSNTFAYTLTGGAIVANRTLNIPITTGTDTLDTLGLAQTLSGVKTFTGGISMSGAVINMNTQRLYLGSSTAEGMIFRSGTTGSLVLAGQNSSTPIQFLIGGPGGSEFLGIADSGSSITSYVDLLQTTGKKITYNVGSTTYGIESSAGVLDFYSNSNNNLRLDANSNVVLGPQSNLTASATNGFQYIRGMTGAVPTGAPTAITGHNPMVFTGTSNKLCVYNGAWKCVTLS